MSLIDGVGPPDAPRSGRSKAREGEGAFSVPFASAAVATARFGGVASTSAAALNGVIALQERGGETVQDRAARRRGQDLLAALSRLQAAILAGEPGSGLLQHLAALAADLPIASGPELRKVLGAIAVRARVELARRES